MSFEDRRKREVETALLALFTAHSRVARLNTNRDSLDEREVEIETKERAERKIAETAVDQMIDGIESLEEYHEYQIDTLSAECEANESASSETMGDCSSLDPDADYSVPLQYTGGDDEGSEEEEADEELAELEDDVIAEADKILEEMEAEQEAEEDGREGAEKEYDFKVQQGDRQVQIVAALLAADDPIGSKESAEWIDENVGLDGDNPVNIASSALSNAYSRDYFPLERDTHGGGSGRWRYVYWIPSSDVEAVREAYSDEIEKLGISDVSLSGESETAESAEESDTDETVVQPSIELQSREHEVLALLTQLTERDEEAKDPIALALHGRRDVSEYSHVLDHLTDDGLTIAEGDETTRYRPSPSGREELNALGGFQVNGTTTYTGP